MSDDNTQDGAEPSPASTGSGSTLCVRVMAHAFGSPHVAGRTAGEVREALRVLFSDDEIEGARRILRGE